jgi:RHS repeat-associated protein
VGTGTSRLTYRLCAAATSAILILQAGAIAPASSYAAPAAPETADADRHEPPAAAPRGAGEQPDLRTAASRTTLNDDGTFTAEIFTGPINYRDADGAWQPIDTSLVEDSGEYAWRNGGNAFGARFKDELGEDAVRFEIGGEVFTLTLDNANRKGAAVRDNRLTYGDALPGVDLQYELLPDGVKETLVLADADAPTRYTFRLDGAGGADLEAEEQPNGDIAVHAAGIPGNAFVLAAPYAVDAGGSEELEPLAEPNATLDVREQSGDLVVTLALDAAWLRDADRTFPVRLDPTITIQPSVEDASFPITCGGCTPFVSDRLYIGGGDTQIWRAALQYDLGAIPAGVSISDADLELLYDGYCISATNPPGGFCGGSGYPLDLHRMTSAWTTSTQSQNLTFGPTADASITFSGSQGWMSWNVTSLVNAWTSGTQANHGVLIKRRTEALSASGPTAPGRRYTVDDTLRPRLVVTYVSDAVTLAPPTTLHANGAELAWSRYTGPSGAPFTKYEVHRSSTANFTPSASTLLATIGDANVTTYRDTTARPQAPFTYRVVANTSLSNAVSVTLPADGRSSIVVQPGPAEGKASWLYGWRAFNVCGGRGSDETLWVGAGPNAVHRPILEYDVRAIPTGATVETATLSMWHSTNFNADSGTIDVHRITRAWTEGAVSGCNGQGADWQETVGGSRWSALGGDFAAQVYASVPAPGGQSAGWHDFNIKTLVEAWVGGAAPNLGLLLKERLESAAANTGFTYFGDDYSVSPTLRPKLAITYVDGSAAQAPHTAVSAPLTGDAVGGNAVAITAEASDDRRVETVDFLVDGNLIGSDTSAPYGITWNATGASAGNHTLTTRAVDDAGNVGTSAGNAVVVDNSAPPTTSITAPNANATVSGSTVTVSANAADDIGVSRVEFYVDDIRIGEDATSPYSITWNTLNADQPFYDGAHVVTSRAYDGGGKVTASAPVNVTANNRGSSMYKATFAPVAPSTIPATMSYDPAAGQQTNAGLDLRITNNSTSAWSSSSVFLRYRWFGPGHSVATPDVTVSANIPLGQNVAGGASVTVSGILIAPPTLAEGVDRAQYRLVFDLFDTTASKYFGEQGNLPLDNPVIVNKVLRTKLGLERFHQYYGTDVGAGMGQLVNVANGNNLLRWTPFLSPGRGLSTVVDLTYNSLEDHSDSPVGNNWSASISGLTRLGARLDVHPNRADDIAGNANRWIAFTDGDGSTHRFDGRLVGSTVVWDAPPGVHLYLREYSTTDPSRKWALTRPDRVTFFFDTEGYPTGVEDKNGNQLRFTLSTVAPGDDPGGANKRVTSVTDAAGVADGAANRSFTISYYTKAEAKKPQVRGRVRTISDHTGSELAFEYYDDGNLRRVIQRGGTNADGTPLADRIFVLTYTTPSGDGPAIPLAANRINPDPKTNQSSRVYSVRDPNGAETLFTYFGPTSGQLRWKLSGITDRAGKTTAFSYDLATRITTVTAPLTRVTRYAYDTDGKVTSITDPANRVTNVTWTGDFHVASVDEPGNGLTRYTYNDNGYLTERRVKYGATSAYSTMLTAAAPIAYWRLGETSGTLADDAAGTRDGTYTGGALLNRPTLVSGGNPAAGFDGVDDRVAATSFTDSVEVTMAAWIKPDDVVRDQMLFSTGRTNYLRLVNGEPFASIYATGFGQITADSNFDLTVGQTSLVVATYRPSEGLRIYVNGELKATTATTTGSGWKAIGNAADPYTRIGRYIDTDARSFDGVIDEVAVFASALSAQQIRELYSSGVNGTGTDLFLTTQLSYDDLPADAADVTANWQTGRDIPHLSQLASRTDPNGTATAVPADDYQWTFDYDPEGNLVTVTDPAGFDTTYAYYANGNLQTATDANTNPTTFNTYDPSGQPTKITDAAGGISQFSYDADGLLRSVQDANHASFTGGDPRTYRSFLDYDSFHRLARQSTPKSTTIEAGELIWSAAFFDPNDNLLREIGPHFGAGYTGAGALTRHTYDVMDRETLTTGPDTTEDPAGERTAMTYDDAGRLATVTLPKGVFTQSIATDYVTTYTYDALDRVVRQQRNLTDGAGVITQSQYTHACYDALSGDVVQLTTPRANLATVSCATPVEANSTTFTYDDAHRQTSTTDALAHRRQTVYDANGNVVTSVNAAGSRTTVVYDERNLPTKIIEPYTSGVGGRAITTAIEYDPVGNRQRLISPRAWDVANGGPTFTQYVTRYVYDALNRLARVDLPIDTAYPTQYYVHNDYDAVGNLDWTSLPVTTASAASVPATSKTQMTRWDPGWIASSDDPGTTPPIHFDYTAEGWQLSRTPELPAGGLNEDDRQTWTYFDDGMLSQRTDSDGHGVEYDYDANNNLRRAVDASGVLADARSTMTVEATWDSLDRLTKSRSKEELASNWRFTTHAYDLNDNVSRRDDDGVETTGGMLVTAGRRNDYTYDAADWLATQLDYGTSTAASDDQRITNTFTATGHEASRAITRNNGSGTWVPKQTTTWSYFLNDQLKKLETKNGAATPVILESHTVDYLDTGGDYVNGHRTKDLFWLDGPGDTSEPCQASPGCTATYLYDPRDKLVREVNGHGATTNYTLDGAGNMTRETVTGDGAKDVTYAYTGMQLTSATAAGATQKFWYDPTSGNLDCVTLSTGGQANCAAGAGGSYSPQVISDYSFDYLDRMTQYRSFVTNGSTSTKDDAADYEYDALDRVVEQTESHGATGSPRTTLLSYLGLGNQVSRETQHNGDDGSDPLLTTKSYASDAFGHRIGMTNSPNGGTAATYTYGYDVHGSVSMLLSNTGSATASYGYRAYGASDSEITKGDVNADNPLNAYRFSGRRLDSGSGSIDMGARRFGPDTARFLQRDFFNGAVADLGLALDPLTQNRYALASGNPISFVEWDGHIALLDGGGGGATTPTPDREPIDYWQYFVDQLTNPSAGGAAAPAGTGTQVLLDERGQQIIREGAERAASYRDLANGARWWDSVKYRLRAFGTESWANLRGGAVRLLGGAFGVAAVGLTAFDAYGQQMEEDADRPDLSGTERTLRASISTITTTGVSFGVGLGGALICGALSGGLLAAVCAAGGSYLGSAVGATAGEFIINEAAGAVEGVANWWDSLWD